MCFYMYIDVCVHACAYVHFCNQHDHADRATINKKHIKRDFQSKVCAIHVSL